MLDQLTIADLKRFAKVAETGSFTAAARVLGQTPKQISRRIARAEEALGVRLFHRTTRAVRLTPEGVRYHAAAVSALEALERATEDITAGDAIAGELHLCVPTMASEWITAWSERILAAHPMLRVVIHMSDNLQDMTRSGLDLALVGRPPTHAGVRVRRLKPIWAKLCATPEYVALNGCPLTVEDLAQHECLLFWNDGPQTHWPLVHEDGRRALVPVSGRLHCGDSRLLLQALHAGMGIGVRPSRVAEPGLVHLLPGWTMGPVELYAVIAPGRRHLARVRVALDALDEIIRDLS